MVRLFKDFTGHYEHFCGSLQSVYIEKSRTAHLDILELTLENSFFMVMETWLKNKQTKNF